MNIGRIMDDNKDDDPRQAVPTVRLSTKNKCRDEEEKKNESFSISICLSLVFSSVCMYARIDGYKLECVRVVECIVFSFLQRW
jgi:hypothetical protein